MIIRVEVTSVTLPYDSMIGILDNFHTSQNVSSTLDQCHYHFYPWRKIKYSLFLLSLMLMNASVFVPLTGCISLLYIQISTPDYIWRDFVIDYYTCIHLFGLNHHFGGFVWFPKLKYELKILEHLTLSVKMKIALFSHAIISLIMSLTGRILWVLLISVTY